MTFPALTAVYAAWLSLYFVGLSIWVTMGRARWAAHHGDGGQASLQRRIRIHANFAEYAPLALILIGLNEARGMGGAGLHLLLGALAFARLVHPIGMLAAEGSIAQYALRAPAMVSTWLVIVAAALLLVIP